MTGFTVLGMHHSAIATEDIDATVRFYEDVLGMKAGPTPTSSAALRWIYAGDQPLFHIFQPKSPRQQADIPEGGVYGVVHLALQIDDFDAACARLQDHGIDHDINIMESRNARQVFFDAPDNVRIELIEFGKVYG